VTSIGVFFAVAAMLVSASLVGAALRRALPEHHLNEHTKDVVRLSASLIATIVGLVLGLLISSAKSNFDAQRDAMRQLTSSVIMLDHTLAEYGPEAAPVRVALREVTGRFVEQLWGGATGAAANAPFMPTSTGTSMYRAVVALAPKTDEQRFYKTQATAIATAMIQQRLTLYEEAASRMPTLLVFVIIAWLCVLFSSFSLFSTLNPTAVGAVTVISMCAAGAFFLLFEMYRPFEGLMQIDKRPLMHALPPLAP
jgi:hypothetical protein